MKEAMYWYNIDESRVNCILCRRACVIQEGETGLCGVYKNIDGNLYSMNYGIVCGMNVERLDKQPISFHPVLSGDSKTLVIGSPGCDLTCKFCINADQSQVKGRSIDGLEIDIDLLIAYAKDSGCESITYAYTEPTVFYEFMLDIAMSVKETTNLKNVVISNGFMSKYVIGDLASYIDAVNIDFKGNLKFYEKLCGISELPLDNIYQWSRVNDVHTEVTTLVIPGCNADYTQLKEIAMGIASIDKMIPWHLTKFYPAYLMKYVPITTDYELAVAESAGRFAGLENIEVWY
jgi:pyruvate formate lyase activating enzyme